MLHRLAGALGFEVRGFQLEIPFGGAVGIVDQHQVWIVLHAFGLHFHGAAILFDELSKNKFQEPGNEWNPSKEVPGGDDVDAAMRARDWSDSCQAGEPV